MKLGDEWETPRWMWKALDDRFEFMFDAACTPQNCKIDNELGVNWPGPGDWYDGLEVEWPTTGWVWCNPPYSNIQPWIDKALREIKRGGRSIFLVPVRSSMPWWRDCLIFATRIYFLQDRVSFEMNGRPVGGSPFEHSCLIEFDGSRPIFTADGIPIHIGAMPVPLRITECGQFRLFDEGTL